MSKRGERERKKTSYIQSVYHNHAPVRSLSDIIDVVIILPRQFQTKWQKKGSVTSRLQARNDCRLACLAWPKLTFVKEKWVTYTRGWEAFCLLSTFGLLQVYVWASHVHVHRRFQQKHVHIKVLRHKVVAPRHKEVINQHHRLTKLLVLLACHAALERLPWHRLHKIPHASITIIAQVKRQRREENYFFV